AVPQAYLEQGSDLPGGESCNGTLFRRRESGRHYCHGLGSRSHGALDITWQGAILWDDRSVSMKVTGLTLVEMIRRVNNEQLKHWDSGLKVERRAEDYVVLRLFRKPQLGSPGSLDLFRGSPREVKAFIEGFANAAGIAIKGAAVEARLDQI